MERNHLICRLGAVIEYFDLTAMVVGYDFVEEQNRLKLAYKIVPYPQGYRSGCKLVKAELCEMLQNGFDTELSREVAGFMQVCDAASEHLSTSEMKVYLQATLRKLPESEVTE